MINHYSPLPTLKEARLKAGWTQTKLAKITDLTQTTISNIERGFTSPADLTRRQIESLFGPVDWKRTRDQGVILSNGHVKKETE